MTDSPSWARALTSAEEQAVHDAAGTIGVALAENNPALVIELCRAS